MNDKNSIKLIDLAESSGIELSQRGNRHIGLCPFHDEKTPSFYIFDNNKFKCFGCGEHGDVIDFYQRINNLSFREALKQLGLDDGPPTKEIIMARNQAKKRRENRARFEKWRIDYAIELDFLLSATEKIRFTPETFEKHGEILHLKAICEYHRSILSDFNERVHMQLYVDKKGRSDNPIRPLWRKGFNFKEWVRGVQR